MAEEKNRMTLKAKVKLEIYPDGVSEEEIKAGKVKPIEVHISEEELELNAWKLH